MARTLAAGSWRAELMIAPSLQTEGKALQRDQAIGMGARGGSREMVAQ